MKTKSAGDKAMDIFIYGSLIFFSLLTIFPFLNIMALSLNEAWDTYKGGLTVYPRILTLENYKAVFDGVNIPNYYKISIFRTVVGTLFSLFFNSITAYALSKKYIKVRRTMLAFLVFTSLFGGGLVPYYIQLRNLGLINNIWVYVLPGVYNVFNILIFRTFFEGIPESLEESARLDGANDITIMWRVIFPLSLPVFAAIALFTGIGHWNDWYTGEFFVYSSKLHTIQNYLLKVLAENEGHNTIDKYRRVADAQHATKVSPESIRMAVLMTATLPIVCIYPFLQKYFVKGVMIGAVKG